MTTTLTNDQITAGAAVLCDLPQHRIDYIARQYFADEQYQVHVKHAISDAFQEARSLALAAPSPQIAEKVELRERQAFAAAMKEAWPGTVRAEDDEYWTGQYGHIWRSAIAASRRAVGVPREPTQAMKDAAYLYREKMYAQDPPQPPTISGYWITMFDAATAAPASAGQASQVAMHEPVAQALDVLRDLKIWMKGKSAGPRQSVDRAIELLTIATQPAEVSAGQAGQVAIRRVEPDECAANMNGHRFGPHGRKGEIQCEWCGEVERAAAPAELTAAARDMLAERRRQVEQEGWTPEQDDQYDGGELSLAASCYAVAGDGPHVPQFLAPQDWPWDYEWWKPTDDRRNLVKAGALILADIERLDRATHQPSAQKGNK